MELRFDTYRLVNEIVLKLLTDISDLESTLKTTKGKNNVEYFRDKLQEKELALRVFHAINDE